jgi:hypothetical protein
MSASWARVLLCCSLAAATDAQGQTLGFDDLPDGSGGTASTIGPVAQ